MRCKRCGSYAINPHCHGREEDIDLDLCDVCYWRKRAEQAIQKLADQDTRWEIPPLSDYVDDW